MLGLLSWEEAARHTLFSPSFLTPEFSSSQVDEKKLGALPTRKLDNLGNAQGKD